MLVHQLERLIPSQTETRGLEYSTILSAALAAIARRNDELESDSSDDRFFFDEAWFRWKTLSTRRFGRSVSPIVVEVSVDPRVSDRHLDSEGIQFWENYRITFRQAKNARLQYAEAGGRFVPGKVYPRNGFLPYPEQYRFLAHAKPGPKWGTLGGFLQTIDGELLGVTAAHVAPENGGYATPAFSGVELFGLRSHLQRLSPMLPSALAHEWCPQIGHLRDADAPRIVAQWQCAATPTPATSGLDVALVHFPTASSERMRRVNVVGTGQVSQSLTAQFQGATSGSRRVRVSALSIWHSYRMPDSADFACVADCFQIALSSRPYFRTDVSRGGDSGAWLMTKTKEGWGWIGVLLGGDGERSGVVPAQRIIDHFTPRLGPLTPMI